MNKGFFDYLAWLTIGYVLLALASWCDDTWAAQPETDKLADKYVQSISDYATKLSDSMKLPMDPQKHMQATLMFMNKEFNAGFPNPLVCKELQKYTRKPCAEAYMAFWKAYKAVDEE
mgnify:CR=1 FL=1|jgi:lipoate-protein ligase A